MDDSDKKYWQQYFFLTNVCYLTQKIRKTNTCVTQLTSKANTNIFPKEKGKLKCKENTGYEKEKNVCNP